MDAMNHYPNLSCFAKWDYSFLMYVMPLEYFHLNEHISILWASTLATMNHDLASASMVEEGT